MGHAGGIQMFMEKLKELIVNPNRIPFIYNNPVIVRERPQFQFLYDELAHMTQTLFIDQHHDLLEKQFNDMKKRLIDAAEEAEYKVDLFLSAVHFTQFPTSSSGGINPSLTQFFLGRDWKEEKRKGAKFIKFIRAIFNLSKRVNLDLDDVRMSFKSVKMELMRVDSIKMDPPQNQAVAAQSSVSRGLKKKVVMDEIFVGLDGDAELIRDKLLEDQKKLTVVSIVGMGGIGKTTLATKVFNDAYVKHHFHVRVWVTVSERYDKRAVLTQILESILDVQLDLEKANDSRLRELVHKKLMGNRYLIVLDDIWHIETWDNLKVFFPHDYNGSRILLTSRLTEVAKHASSDGLIHHLGYLNKERGWELLCQKVFQGNECPEWSIKPGMQIVENCKGLPLAVVVIAGVVAERGWSKTFWEEIAERTGSYIVCEQNGCMETLALSYNHLPLHLRECFLYFGGFPEDYTFRVKRLIWLWVAEGFIQQDGNGSLEDIAEGYLMNLIDKNLVIVADRSKCNGGVKTFKVHDLVRELCIKKAKEEQFMLADIERLNFCAHSNVTRMLINEDINIQGFSYSPTPNLRSIWCFNNARWFPNYTANALCSFVLLRALDLRECALFDIPEGMESLVHLRYLAIQMNISQGFPSSICRLWNLQTLIIYISKDVEVIALPSNISDMVNLKHLCCRAPYTRMRTMVTLVLPSIKKPMNLQTISCVSLGDEMDNFQKWFPYVKELTYCDEKNPGKENDFKSLSYLEKLKFISFRKTRVTSFPATLKSLTLEGCGLAWSEMSIIQGLPNLQVLKLHKTAFVGRCWDTDGQEFPRLSFLRLRDLDIEQWEASFPSFPCLKQLEFFCCLGLNETPLEIGDIPTLELIKITGCWKSVGESVRRIQEEQRDVGNYDLKIDIAK